MEESEPSQVEAAKKFVSSKWETVDPEKLEKQAITTSKWDFFDENAEKKEHELSKSKGLTSAYDSDTRSGSESSDFDDDIDGMPMDDEKQQSVVEKKVEPPMNSSSVAKSIPVAAAVSSKEATIIGENRRKMLREIEVRNIEIQPKNFKAWSKSLLFQIKGKTIEICRRFGDWKSEAKSKLVHSGAS